MIWEAPTPKSENSHSLTLLRRGLDTKRPRPLLVTGVVAISSDLDGMLMDICFGNSLAYVGEGVSRY